MTKALSILYLLCCIYVSPLRLLGQLGSLHQLVLLCHGACKECKVVLSSSICLYLHREGAGGVPRCRDTDTGPCSSDSVRTGAAGAGWRQEAGGLVTVSPCQARCQAPGPGLPVCAGLLGVARSSVTLLTVGSSRPGVNCPAAPSPERSPGPARSTDSTAGVKTDPATAAVGRTETGRSLLHTATIGGIAAISTLVCWPICSCRVAGAVRPKSDLETE